MFVQDTSNDLHSESLNAIFASENNDKTRIMEEKTKKQIIVGGGAAGAVAMGAGAAVLMPGQVAEESQEPLLAQNTTTDNASESFVIEPDSVVEATPIEDTPIEPTPVEPSEPQTPHEANKPNSAHSPNKPHESHSSNVAHTTPEVHQEAAIPAEPVVAQETDAPFDSLEPEGMSDHILAINVNPEDYMPESDFDNEIQVINTPDDAQFFVVDVNSDGIYDTIYDESGMEMANVPEGSYLADASYNDDDIYIASDDDIQVIGNEIDHDMAIINDNDMEMEMQEDPFSQMDEQLQADVLHDLEVMQEGLDNFEEDLSAAVDEVVDEFSAAVDESFNEFADLFEADPTETDEFSDPSSDMDDLSDLAMQ